VADALAILANAAGKLTREGLRVSGRGATALPGLVALTLDPDFIGALSASLSHGVICISGTNGKTTTARMLADMTRTAGWDAIHNRSGSNLDRGVASALLAETNWSAEPSGDFGLFEIDEASLPGVVGKLRPRVVVVTNLFRDQMDRYFELDALAKRIGSALASLDPETKLVLNADDPLVANLAVRRDANTVFFGIDDPYVGSSVPQAISDATRCPRCRSPLVYKRVVLAHEGDWCCTNCGLARPRRDVAATKVVLRETWTEMQLAGTVGNVFEPACRSPVSTTRTTRSRRSRPRVPSISGSPKGFARSRIFVPHLAVSRPSISRAGRCGSSSSRIRRGSTPQRRHCSRPVGTRVFSPRSTIAMPTAATSLGSGMRTSKPSRPPSSTR
jgi:UDP-N-acetylmuramyl tripeptide synthase